MVQESESESEEDEDFYKSDKEMNQPTKIQSSV